MFNLLAILLSMAMMLTGASGTVGANETAMPLAEPAARVLTLSNLTITHGEDEVTLNPSASLGVMTDGVQSTYDFHIDLNGQRLLPFQIIADADGLLAVSESSGVTVKWSAAEIEQMINQQVNSQIENSLANADSDTQEILTFVTQEFLPAYVDLIKLVGDPEAQKALQENGDRIYGEVIERGDGSPAQIDYAGTTYDVMTYSYILDSEDLGRLMDALCDTNEVMDRYTQAYFKLLKLASKDEPKLAELDSFAAIMRLVDMRMNVTESLSEADQLDLSDIVMQVSIPEVDDPLEMTIHSERLGDDVLETVSGLMDVEGNAIEIYAESVKEGETQRGMMSMNINLKDADAEAVEEAVEEAEAVIEGEEAPLETSEEADEMAETLSELVEGEVEVIDKDGIDSDADGEEEDADDAYVGFDFYVEPSEDGRTYGVSWSVDVKDEASVNFTLEGLDHGDGNCENRINIYAYNEDDTYEIAFNADASSAPFEANADAENAVSVGDVDFTAVQNGAIGDVMKLSAEPSVRELIDMIGAVSGGMASEDVQAPDAGLDGDDEDDGDDADDAAARSAEPYDDGELAFGTPRFGWLPEGYEIVSTDVDTQYDIVDFDIANAASGNSLYVSFGSNDLGTMTRYILGDDGSVEAIEGAVLIEQEEDGYRRYSLEAEDVYISLFPYGDDLDVETIGRILANLAFDGEAA